MAKSVTRCGRCAVAAHKVGFGFTRSGEAWYCTETGREVQPDDGCTLGVRGSPTYAVDDIDVCLGDGAAAFGCWEDGDE